MAITLDITTNFVPVAQAIPQTNLAVDQKYAEQLTQVYSSISSSLVQQAARAEKARMLFDEAQTQANLFAQQRELNQPLEIMGLASVASRAVEEVLNQQEQIKLFEAKKAGDIYKTSQLLQAQEAFMLKENEFIQTMDADGSGFTERMQNFMNDYISKTIKGAPTEESKLDLYENLTKLRLGALERSIDLESKTRNKFYENQLDQSLGSITNQINLNPIQFQQYVDQGLSTISQYNQLGLDENKLNLKKQVFYNKALTNLVSNAVNSDPVGTLNFLTTQANNPLVDSDTYTKLIKETVSGINDYKNNKNKEYQLTVADILQTSPAGTSPIITKQVGDKLADLALDQSYIQLQQKLIVDPSINKEMAITQFVQNSGVVPPSLVKELNTFVSTNIVKTDQDAVQSIFYANVLKNLTSDPKLSTKVVAALGNDEVIKRAETLSFYASLYPDQPLEAVNKTNMALQPITDPVKQQRFELMKKHDQVFKDPKVAIDVISDFFDDEFFTRQSAYNEDAVALLPDFKMAYQEMKLQTGDPDLAQAYALKTLSSRYAKTEINGRKQIMRYAPESLKQYRDPNSIEKFYAQWNQLKEKIPTIDPNAGISVDMLRLVPNETTPLDGSYSVMAFDPNGRIKNFGMFKPDLNQLTVSEQELLDNIKKAKQKHEMLMQDLQLNVDKTRSKLMEDAKLTAGTKNDIISLFK